MWLPLQLLMFSWLHFAHGFRFPNEGKELKSSKVQKEAITLDNDTDLVKDLRTQSSIQSVTLSKSNQVKTFIRRSDQLDGLNFALKDINPDFLKEVFKLENPPKYLMAENGDIFSLPIDSTEFASMDSYVVDVPGTTPVIATKKRNTEAEDPTGEKSKKPQRRYNIPILSGTAFVGQLYDGSKDQILHDRFLWAPYKIKTRTANITNVKFETRIEDTQNDRMKNVAMDSSQKLSFLAGLVKTTGSADYLNDEVNSEDVVRLTFSYKKKSKQTQIISNDSDINPFMCKKDIGATHVITEVKTGFQAFLIFESKRSENISKKEVGDSMNTLVKGLPAEIVEGDGFPEDNKSEKELEQINSIRSNIFFKFYGDTVIDPPPATYEDAIEVYKTLPAKSLVEERVISFSVAPITDYCDERHDILVDIANKNVEDVGEMFMDFRGVEKFFRTLKGTRVASDFQRYRAVLLDLEQRFDTYQSTTTSEIQKVLPKIRDSSENEASLVQIVIDYRLSLFEKETFFGLLYTRQKEIETMQYIIYHPELPPSVLIDLDKTGDMSKCIIENDYTLVYELEVLPKDPEKIGEDYENGVLIEDNRWFMSKEKIGLNRPLLGTFLRLSQKNEEGAASICFLISLNRDGASGEENKPFRLRLLKNGKVLISDYKDPEPVSDLIVVDAGYDSVKMEISWVPIDQTLTDVHYQVKTIYNQFGFEERIEDVQEIDLTQTAFNITLENLQPNQFYEVKFEFLLFQGKDMIVEGVTSRDFFFSTRPSSTPANLKCHINNEFSLTFTWEEPVRKPDILEYFYIYEFDTDDSNYISPCADICDTDKTDKEFLNLVPSMLYRFGIFVKPDESLEIDTDGEGLTVTSSKVSVASKVQCYTPPPKITGLKKEGLEGYLIITLSWNTYTMLNSSEFQRYELEVQLKDDNSISPAYYDVLENSITLTDLSPDTFYDIRIRVFAVPYDYSIFSEVVTVHTKQPERVYDIQVLENSYNSIHLSVLHHPQEEENTHDGAISAYTLITTITELNTDGGQVETKTISQSIDMSQTSTEVILNSLKQNRFYLVNFKIKWMKGSHLIANGDVSDDFYVSTRPSSPPTQLLCMATSANTMRFEWQNPLFMPDLESISFLYNLTPENTSELHSSICPCEVSDLNVEITELEPISAYNFEVSVKQVPLEVVVNGGGMQTSNLGSLSISTKCYTKPPKITGLAKQSAPSANNASFIWNGYKLISDEQFQAYEVYYYRVLDELNENYTLTTSYPECELINLVASSPYKIRVRVVSTTYKSSVWSDELQFVTADLTGSELSAIEQLRDDIIVKFEQHSALIEDLLSEDTTIKDSIEDLNSKDTTIEDSVEVMKVNLEDVIDNRISLIDVKITELESNVTELESNVSTIIDTKIGEFDVKIDTLETNISTLIDTKLVELEDDIVSIQSHYSCKIQFYGETCENACDCNQDGSDDCLDDGNCICKENISGEKCDSCMEDAYGTFPNCIACNCNSIGSNGISCNISTGECECNIGYSGTQCNNCADEYYGWPTCNECGCNTNGSLVSICDDTTGLCLCKPNIIGAKCDSCDSGYTGFPDCIQDLFGGQANRFLVVGGYLQSSSPSTEVIDVSNNSLTCNSFGELETLRGNAVGGLLENTPIVCGGYESSSSILQSCLIFGQSQTLTMTSKRNGAASVVLNTTTLWVMGGLSDTSYHYLSSTEFITLEKSVPGPSLYSGKNSYFCSVKYNETHVYEIGGFYATNPGYSSNINILFVYLAPNDTFHFFLMKKRLKYL